MIAAALLWTVVLLQGVVDQMDGGVAAVEWSGGTIGFLPTSTLPDGTGEGDRLEVWVWCPHGQGPAGVVVRGVPSTRRDRVRHDRRSRRARQRRRHAGPHR